MNRHEENFIYILLSERSQVEMATSLYDSRHTTFWTRQTLRQQKDQRLPEARGTGD